MPRPMMATTGGASFRNDDSLYRYGSPLQTLGQQVGDQPRPVANPTVNIGWITMGRDPLLEQKMLGKVLSKLGIAQLPPAAMASSQAPASEPLSLPPSAPQATPQESAGPIFGTPIGPEQLPPGAMVAPGPPVPIESLPMPR